MKVKASGVMVVLAAILAIGSAQAQLQTGRTFTYSAGDLVQSDFSKDGTVTVKALTSVGVQQYLYVSGNLSANWTVQGWGTGIDTEVNSIYFYHTETLTLQLQGFDDPEKTSGTNTGVHKVKMDGQLRFFNNATAQLLYDSGMIKAADLNSLGGSNGPKFTTGQSGGVMRLDFSRQLQVTPQVGPGQYQNVGTITVLRN